MTASTGECERCRGLFEPLSRQASQNSMGPWFIRDEANPFLPGCSIQTLRTLIRRGRVTRETILRGPSTRQFWTFARNAPGIANLLGECHACHADASPDDARCSGCGASFAVLEDRERLGLSDVRLLPGKAAPEQIAAASGTFGTRSSAVTETASSNGSAAAVAESRPAIIEFPHDAQALIAASHRRKRERQRITIAVVLACAAIAVTTGAVMFVVANRPTPPRQPIPTQSPPQPSPASPALPTDASHAQPSASPAAQPPTDADEYPQSGKTPYADLIAGLSSPDLAVAAAALASVQSDDLKTSDELRAAVRAAEIRIRMDRFGTRL